MNLKKLSIFSFKARPSIRYIHNNIFIPVSPILIIRCLDKVPIRVQGGGTSQPTRNSHAGQGTDLGRFFNSLATRRNSIVTMNSLCLLVFVKSHQKHHIIYYTPFFLLIIVAPFFSSNLYLRQISKIFNSIFIFFFRTTCFDLLALLVGFPIFCSEEIMGSESLYASMGL